MARLKVYRDPGGGPWLLDVQSDLIDLNVRTVVPLLPVATAPMAAARLNPDFEIGEARVRMMTQYIASVPETLLRQPIADLAERDYEITAALDMLFFGF